MKARFVLVSLLVVCATFSRAQQGLTQAQIQAAFVEALKEFALYSSGYDYLLATQPDPSSSGGQLYGLGQFMLTDTVRGITPLSKGFAKAWDSSIKSIPDLLAAVQSMTNSAARAQILAALGSVTNLLSNIDENTSSVDSSLNTISGLVSANGYKLDAIESDVSGLSYYVEETASDVSDTLSILQGHGSEVPVDIRQTGVAYGILSDILDAIGGGGGGGGVAGILEGITNSLSGDDVTPVEVQNFADMLSVLYSAVDYAYMSYYWNVLVQNFDEEGNDWKTAFESSDLMASISNSLASFVLSRDEILQMRNSVSNTVSTVESEELENARQLNSVSNAAANFEIDFSQESHTSSDNPWREAPILNLESSARRFFAQPDPATSSDVLIMGSNNPNQRRSGPVLKPLPEIRFDLESVFLRTNELQTMTNLFSLLWRVLAGAFQIALVADFVHWYATRNKG